MAKTIIILSVVAGSAVLGFWLWNRTTELETKIPETNIAAGAVAEIGAGRIYIVSDIPAAGGGFKKLGREVVLNKATQIEKYNSLMKGYEPIGAEKIKAGYSAQIYYSGPADAETLDASLIQVTDPADSMTAEDLIKSLK